MLLLLGVGTTLDMRLPLRPKLSISVALYTYLREESRVTVPRQSQVVGALS